MRALPTGTATFLFSDIEGSTRLVEALGDRFGDLLGRHHELVRAAVREHNGVEVSTEGDSFFVVFHAAADALAAAATVQRAIAAEPWIAGAAVRVRIGVHTGEARLGADTYVGIDVHRAARIMAAAHGGQVLASETTRALLADAAPDGLQLRSLGEHRLRDLPRAERLYQVVGEGLAADFPPPRTADSIPANLPLLGSDIVGRDGELAAIHDRIRSPGVRILTLVGPGGIGKTRLAVHAAAAEVDHFHDGAHFVDLAPARDVVDVHQAVVRSVELAVPADARELGDAVAEQLRPREALLVLDNFEQVMAAAPEVAQLVRRCPRLKVLVTSREPLRVQPEEVLTVQPLALPAIGRATLRAADIAGSAAVQLFVERAGVARPGFELTDENAAAIADICARLDGLPLAIELAAARLRLFSPGDLRDRLRSRLDVLRGGARDLPDRQRTLRDAIAWSHELLDDDERRVFRVLSVFASARVESVEDVVSVLDGHEAVDVVGALGSLVEKSLVRSVVRGAGPRLSMLETIREFATDRLEADPAVARAAHDAHAAAYADLAARLGARVRGPERTATLDELAADVDDLLAAWRHYLERGDIARLDDLLDPLWALHDARGWYHGLLGLSEDLLAVLSADAVDAHEDEAVALRLTVGRGLLAVEGYTERVEQIYQQALADAARSGRAMRQFAVLRHLATFHLARGEINKVVAIGEDVLAMARAEGDVGLEVEGHVILGPAIAFLGDTSGGLEHLDRAMALYDRRQVGSSRLRLGPSPHVVARSISALFHWLSGHPAEALRRAALGTEVAVEIDHPYSLAYATFHGGLLDLWTGRIDAAASAADAVIALAEERDYQVWKAVGVVLKGVTTAIQGRAEEGREITLRGIGMYADLQTPPVFWPQLQGLKARACALAGRPDEALAALAEGLAVAGEAPNTDGAALRIGQGELLASEGDGAGAVEALRKAYDDAGAIQAPMLQLQAAILLVQLAGPGDAGALERLRTVRDRIAADATWDAAFDDFRVADELVNSVAS